MLVPGDPPGPIPTTPPPRNPILGLRITASLMNPQPPYDWRDDDYLSTPYLVGQGGNPDVIKILRDMADSDLDERGVPEALNAYESYLHQLTRFDKDKHTPAAEVWKTARLENDPDLDRLDQFVLSDAPTKEKSSLVYRIECALRNYFLELDRLEGERLLAQQEAEEARKQAIQEEEEAKKRQQAIADHDRAVLAPQKALTSRARGSQSGMHKKYNEVMFQLGQAKADFWNLAKVQAINRATIKVRESEIKNLKAEIKELRAKIKGCT